VGETIQSILQVHGARHVNQFDRHVLPGPNNSFGRHGISMRKFKKDLIQR